MNVLKLTFLGIVLFLSTAVKSQVSVNIGSPPMWAPVEHNNVRYYYLPDAESYYDVESSRFIYSENGVWVRRANLPGRYRNYDLYNGYKVVLTDYRGNEPYVHFNDHKIKYKKGYRGGPQKTIGQKPGKENENDEHKGNSNQRNNQPNKEMNKGGKQHEGNGGNNGGSHGGGGRGKK